MKITTTGNRLRAMGRILLLMAAFGLTPTLAAAQDGFALRDEDRVVFYGDSITDQRRYTTFAETYVVTRFPKMTVRFVHSGWGGDRVSGGGGGPIDVRLWRDVLPYNPTVVTVMLGMNDGGYRAFDPKVFDDFANGYKHVIETIKRQLPGVRITAIQPSAYDDVTRAPGFEGGYNKVLVQYGEFLKELAAGQGLSVADLNTPLVAALTRAKAADPTAAARLIPDRVHPGDAAALVMAIALLKSWNAPPTVTEVEIDAVQSTATAQVNTRVLDIRSSKGLSWSQMDEALPMPVAMQDPLIALAVRSSDFVEALNRQPLRVKGLATGQYTLSIDGESMGSWSSEQLAAGINLAELPTPMARQAAGVHALTLQHNAVHFTRWRQVQVALQKNESPEVLGAMKALDELEERLIREQRAAAQPRTRRFAVTPN